MRACGYVPQIVERRVARNVTHDLLGCIDLIALRATARMVGIQATDRTNISKRVNKILRGNDCDPAIWLRAHGSPGLLVVGWGTMAGGDVRARVVRIAGSFGNPRVVQEWDGPYSVAKAIEHCQATVC